MNYENIFLSEEELQRQRELENIKMNGLEGLTLLTIEQIFGNENIEQLDIFKNYGTKAAITDFTVALGGFIAYDIYTNEGNKLENRTGWYWNKNSVNYNARVVGFDGSMLGIPVYFRIVGCRPVLPFSSISKISSNIVKDGNGVEVEYGEYPQWVCSKNLSEELEKLYLNNKLNKTGKSYTTDSRHYNEYDKYFYPQKHIEYEYNGKKYVRVKVNSYFDGREITFSNGEEYKDGDYIWIEVSLIKWLVDENSDIAITKNIIVAGIEFNHEINYTKDNFDEMNIKKFLDNYLSKDIIPSEINYEIKEELEPQTLEEALKQAKYEMNEILNSVSFQKVKKR